MPGPTNPIEIQQWNELRKRGIGPMRAWAIVIIRRELKRNKFSQRSDLESAIESEMYSRPGYSNPARTAQACYRLTLQERPDDVPGAPL